MATAIRPKRSSTPGAVPALGDLVDGELAVNLADRALFVRSGGEVLSLPGAVSGTGTTTDAPTLADGDAITPGQWSVLDATSAACACTLTDGDRIGQVVALSKRGAFPASVTGTTIDGQPDATLADPGIIATLRWAGGSTGWESYS